MADTHPPLLAVCAVEAELAPLRDRLEAARRLDLGLPATFRGRIGEVPVLAIATGVGKTNAAHGVTLAIERAAPAGVLSFGVAGAFPTSGLRVGDLALATAEVYGDEGSFSPAGWLSTRELGFPLAHSPAGPCYNEFPLDPDRTAAAARILEEAGLEVRRGTFVTVSSCSGTDARAAEVETRFGAIAETMEGAAHAHVAALRDLPFLEVRGISNVVEDRDPARWNLPAAMGAAAEAAAVLAAHWLHIAA
jgi:futalosine hydrolase